jgi:hypothetical protein
MAYSQNSHLANVNFRGNISSSSGGDDFRKVAKTKTDGRFHWSLLDIFPILQNAHIIHRAKIYPEQVIVSDDGTDNFVTAIRGYDATLRVTYLKALARAAAQDVDYAANLHLPYLFQEWDDAAITGVLYISDQANVSLDAYLYTPDYAGTISTKLFADMTKTVVGPGNIAKVEFSFTKAEMYAGIGGIKYGLKQSGTETVVLVIKATLANKDDWANFLGESINAQMTVAGAHEGAGDGWTPPLCGSCDICDTCDKEGCGTCDACDSEGCTSCDMEACMFCDSCNVESCMACDACDCDACEGCDNSEGCSGCDADCGA